MINYSGFFRTYTSADSASVLQPWYDSLSVKPSEGLWTDLKIFAQTLVDNGKWSLIDFILMIAAMETDEQRTTPLFTSSGLGVTVIGSPVFDISNGVKGNGTSDYFNFNWNPVVHGLNYTLNDASIGYYLHGTQNSSRYALGNLSSRMQRALPVSLIGTINGTTLVNASQSGLGHRATIRISSTQIVQKITNLNPTNSVAASNSDVSLSSDNFYGLCYNNVGVATGFSNDTIRSFYWGGKDLFLDEDFRTAINTFYTSRGLTIY